MKHTQRLKAWCKTSPCQDAAHVWDEPLRRVESQDADSVETFQAQLHMKTIFTLLIILITVRWLHMAQFLLLWPTCRDKNHGTRPGFSFQPSESEAEDRTQRICVKIVISESFCFFLSKVWWISSKPLAKSSISKYTNLKLINKRVWCVLGSEIIYLNMCILFFS